MKETVVKEKGDRFFYCTQKTADQSFVFANMLKKFTFAGRLDYVQNRYVSNNCFYCYI